MPKYYCEYCDIYLTHDSASVRKAHNAGKNHLLNVRTYYAELGQDKAQALIDQVTGPYENLEENGLSHQYGFNNGMPLTAPYPPDSSGAKPFPAMGQTTTLPYPYPYPYTHPSAAVFLNMAMAPGQSQPPPYGPPSIPHGPLIGTGSVVSPSVFQGQSSHQALPPPPGLVPFMRPMAAPGSVTHLSSEIKAMRL